MGAINSATERLHNILAARLYRRTARQREPKPIVSFTFDDFPRSAATVAGRMLKDSGVCGTYYVSLGLMGSTTVLGEMFDGSDLEALVAAGHELACHTFGHVLSSKVAGDELLENCRDNRARIAQMLRGYSLENFSFPEGVVTASAKALLSGVYRTCRTIEPGINRDPVDLVFLRANRIYSQWGVDRVKELIQQNQQQNGWTILYTHDVCATPSPYGCTPEEFGQVLECALQSGAEILPVKEARRRFTDADAATAA